MTEAQDSFRTNSSARASVGKHIAAMSEQISSIRSALRQVTGISRQIQILSYNASIEAARAGVAGRGFAVVAEEAGKLSQNTAAAVSEIGQSIEAMHALLDDTVSGMEGAKEIGAQFDDKLDACVEHAKQLDGLLRQMMEERAPE